MADTGFRVRPVWPEFMIYEETEAGSVVRSLSFDCREMDEPPQVCVPSPERWAAKVAPWAQAQRELIVQRLRGANCVVVEQGEEVDTTLAPDGSFRVEQCRTWEDRIGQVETLSIVSVPDGEQLAWVSEHGSMGRLRFPAPGVVELSLVDRRAGGERRTVRIEPSARTFRFEPGGIAEPLGLLLDRLGWNDPPRPYVSPPQAPAPFARTLAFLGMLVALVFVFGGAWMALSATTPKERWTGALGVAFFGACAYASLKEWRSGASKPD